jgi:glycerophosphoryl diester phosphodiesterase
VPDAVTDASSHPAFRRLHEDPRPRPLVAAHRGESCRHPENTLASFRSATSLGVAVQEFDVRELRDGQLVCVHDASFDRTTDAARTFGPGRLVADCTLADVRRLDAGGGEIVPTLAEALAAMLPQTVPLIEHKAGRAASYVAALDALGVADQVILQSFDWRFLQEVRRLAPRLALGALGPNPFYAHPDDEVLALLAGFEAGLVHWRATDLRRTDVERAHAAGLLVCSYTTDDELGWRGGRALGIDAMCTNDPAAMQRVVAQP